MSKKFDLYRVVTGPIVIGASTEVLLGAAQYAPRAHNVTIVDRSRKDGVVVAGNVPLEFKRGETIGLTERPDNLTGKIELESALGDGEPKPAAAQTNK